jgi:hypothetical protein
MEGIELLGLDTTGNVVSGVLCGPVRANDTWEPTSLIALH